NHTVRPQSFSLILFVYTAPFNTLSYLHQRLSLLFFFFNNTAPTEIYTLSLHDALPISGVIAVPLCKRLGLGSVLGYLVAGMAIGDRKSTRLNSSHDQISYAVFCLKKKKK